MTFIKQTVGLLRSVRRWGVPGLLLALAVTLGSGEVAAATRTINLNTGYDQWSSTAIAPGQQDNEWRVTSPLLNQGVPIAAFVVNGAVWESINPNLPTSFPKSRWISINPAAASLTPVPISYDYNFYFTLPPGFSSPNLAMKLNSDEDIIKVTLNSSSCVLFSGNGGIFTGSPLPLPSAAPSCFKSGSQVNVITVTVQDTIRGSTGLVVDGAVTYEDCDRLQVALIPDVNFITFLEGTNPTPTSIQIPINDTRLKVRIPSLGSVNDFVGVPNEEFYDVFFSNWDGTVNPNGQFVTIEALWDRKLPAGGG